MNIYNKKINENIFIKFFLFTSWIFLIFFYSRTFPDKYVQENIFEIYNLKILTTVLIYLIAPILLILIFKLKEIKLSNFIKLFILYFFSLIIGFLNNYNKNSELYFYLHFFYIYFLIILYFVFIENIMCIKLVKIMVIATISVSIIISLFFITNKFVTYGENLILIFNEKFYINTNGLSRHYLIFFFLLFIYLISNNLNYYAFILIVFANSYLVQQIILLESRLIFVALVLGVVILIFFLNKKNLFKNFVAGILILIISIVMIYQTNANYNFKKTRLYFLQGEKIRSGNEVYNEKIISSTGRTQKWEYLLDDIFKNKYLGSGPESDRRILTTYNFNSGNDAASATIYAFVCGGIIGLLLILIFYLRIIYNCWFLIFKRKIFEGEDLLIKLSVTLVGFLIWRSLFESSFASINFDLFLMLTCVSYIEHVKIKDFYKKK
jgi:hypothetical protein